MDLKAILATLATLTGAARLTACGDEAEKSSPATSKAAKPSKPVEPDAKPVSHAKSEPGGEQGKVTADGEMSCAPGQCAEGMCGGRAKAENEKAEEPIPAAEPPDRAANRGD